MPFEQIISRILANAFFLLKKNRLKNNRAKFLVFTGTVGKTTLRDVAAYALKEAGFRVQSNRLGYTNELGIILSALGLANNFSFKKISSWKKLLAPSNADNDFILIELGADFYRDINWFLDKFSPFAVFLSGIAAQSWSENINVIAAERKKLLENVPANGCVIYNLDDDQIKNLILKNKVKAKKISFSLENKNATIYTGYRTKTILSQSFLLNKRITEQINIRFESDELIFKFSRPLFDPQVYGLMSAIGFLKFLSANFSSSFIEKIEHCGFSSERLQMHFAKNGALIIEDSYKATPLCTFWFLEISEKIKARKKILIITEMRPLRINAKKYYCLLAQKIDFADEIYFLGPRKIFNLVSKLNQKIKLIAPFQYGAIAEKIKKSSVQGDIILLKGSWRYHLNQIRDLLL